VIDESTLVVTSVRDEQLVDNIIPVDKMLRHDVPVDVICTNTRTIRVTPAIPKPTGSVVVDNDAIHLKSH